MTVEVSAAATGMCSGHTGGWGQAVGPKEKQKLFLLFSNGDTTPTDQERADATLHHQVLLIIWALLEGFDVECLTIYSCHPELSVLFCGSTSWLTSAVCPRVSPVASVRQPLGLEGSEWLHSRVCPGLGRAGRLGSLRQVSPHS